MSKYLVSGDARDTDLQRLLEALSGPEWTLDDRGDELKLEADGVVIDIYDHAADRNGRQFLISGRLRRDLPAVKSLLDTLGSRLRNRGIVHTLETVDEQGQAIHSTSYLGR
jgi:hypothetical protein